MYYYIIIIDTAAQRVMRLVYLCSHHIYRIQLNNEIITIIIISSRRFVFFFVCAHFFHEFVFIFEHELPQKKKKRNKNEEREKIINTNQFYFFIYIYMFLLHLSILVYVATRFRASMWKTLRSNVFTIIIINTRPNNMFGFVLFLNSLSDERDRDRIWLERFHRYGGFFFRVVDSSCGV